MIRLSPWIVGGAALAALGSFAGTSAAPDRAAAEELVFFVQYVGSDYGTAVQQDKVIDPVEYQEVLDLSSKILETYATVRPNGDARADLVRLRGLVQHRAPWGAVRAASHTLAARIAEDLGVPRWPEETPDLERGRALFGEDCAPCHGATGGGDGFAADAMTPKPTSFREQRIAMISPHQVFNAASFGVSGTGMPAYREALPRKELWDLAFFVMTLRDGFDPSRPVEVVPLSLKDLAARCDEELLTTLRTSRPEASASELDFYRANFHGSEPADAGGPAPVSENGVELAERLQRTFAGIAEKVFPSVVGISVYETVAAKEPAREGWKGGDAEARLYPGLHRTSSGTGFVVSGDGYVLTYAGVLGHADLAANTAVVDVELTGNVHCRARVVGIEPSIDLAVLKIVAPVPVRPVTLGDSDNVRVGHWAIAVGDPPGPGRTFAPGTIAARPERECYQEHRTSTLLQSSVTIDPGGFGGPLVNIHGEVVGITIPGPALPATASGASSPPVDALPINLAMTIYRALKVKESSLSPWIGISVLDLSARISAGMKSTPPAGLYIDDVFEPSPASRMGIRMGDVLIKMDDHPMLGVSDFQTWLYRLGIDKLVTLEIYRDGKTLRKAVTIEQRPESAQMR